MAWSRRIAFFLVGAIWLPGGGRLPGAEPPRLLLQAVDAERQLPPRLFGASAEPMVERLLGRPEKLALDRQVAPAIVRFPGGSQANFYDWRTGLLQVPTKSDSSAYVRFWASAATRIARAFPTGITLEEYAPFAQALNADVILVPNLETSTVDEQVTWFRQLKADGVLPRNIELGNEFYLGMLGDPDSMRRWPDEAATMVTLHRYERRFRSIVGPGAKFAVQAAGSALWVEPDTKRPFQRRLLAWDRALKPEPWFDAVTLHFYLVPTQLARLPSGETPDGLFSYLMGRGDAGVDRTLRETERRMPGKEIWITEWNARGGEPPYPGQPEIVSPPMIAQVATRMMLVYLRHPAVTKSLYFMLDFDGHAAFQAFTWQGGSYRMLPGTVILKWFNEAVNSGPAFQRLVETGAKLHAAGSGTSDRYFEIEGARFHSATGTTLILQNASSSVRSLDPTDDGRRPLPKSIEAIVTPDLGDFVHRPAEVRTIVPSRSVVIPARSIVRMAWND